MSSLDLGGVLIPAATPFDPVTGEVDVVGFRANVRAWLEEPVLGVVVAGSTGEAVLLDEGERIALLEAARDVVGGGPPAPPSASAAAPPTPAPTPSWCSPPPSTALP